MTGLERASDLYDQGRLTAAARAKARAADKDGYGVTAAILSDLAERVDALTGTVAAIAAHARWYANNSLRDPHEVDFALCVTTLDMAEKALARDCPACGNEYGVNPKCPTCAEHVLELARRRS